MARAHTSTAVGSRAGNPIIVPELEALAATYTPPCVSWTAADLATLRSYYGRVDPRDLARHLRRSVDAIQRKARREGPAIARD